MTHAGLPPQWSLATAKQKAAEVEQVLASGEAADFFRHMYGDTPATLSSKHPKNDRLRVITNYFTRMRFCDAAGKLELNCKSGPEQTPDGYLPWYAHSNRKADFEKIIFGHWAALEGRDCGKRIFPLDTGCVWGNRLRMLDLTSKTYIHCDCGK